MNLLFDFRDVFRVESVVRLKLGRQETFEENLLIGAVNYDVSHDFAHVHPGYHLLESSQMFSINQTTFRSYVNTKTDVFAYKNVQIFSAIAI